MSINIITQGITALTVFPQRSTYTDTENASNQYAEAVEGWLSQEQLFNADLIAFRGQLNTSIEQFNTHFVDIDNYVASAASSAQSAADDAAFCAGVSATLAEGTINDSASTLTTAWSSYKLSNLFTAYDTALGQKLESASYTATDVLAKVKEVDGTGSGLDADLLDGKQSATGATASTVPVRDANADLTSRAFITTYTAQSTTPSSTVNIFFRDTDNIIKPLTATAFKAWLESIGVGANMFTIASNNVKHATSNVDTYFFAHSGTVRIKFKVYNNAGSAQNCSVTCDLYALVYSPVASAPTGVMKRTAEVTEYLAAYTKSTTERVFDIPVLANSTLFCRRGTTGYGSAQDISISYDITTVAPAQFSI